MYVCMCVCMYVCMYVCMNVCVRESVSAYACIDLAREETRKEGMDGSRVVGR